MELDHRQETLQTFFGLKKVYLSPADLAKRRRAFNLPADLAKRRRAFNLPTDVAMVRITIDFASMFFL